MLLRIHKGYVFGEVRRKRLDQVKVAKGRGTSDRL